MHSGRKAGKLSSRLDADGEADGEVPLALVIGCDECDIKQASKDKRRILGVEQQTGEARQGRAGKHLQSRKGTQGQCAATAAATAAAAAELDVIVAFWHCD